MLELSRPNDREAEEGEGQAPWHGGDDEHDDEIVDDDHDHDLD